MRVIAGEWRGRGLVAPDGRLVRPTSEKMRGALFSILGERVRGARFADLCAGSGAIGIEALSRGAAHCLFIESGREALPALRTNLEKLGLGMSAGGSSGARARILERDVLAAIRGGALAGCDLIFADPPYDSGLGSGILSALAEAMARGGRGGDERAEVIFEHRRTDPPPAPVGGLRHTRAVGHGEGVLSFYIQASYPGQGPAGGAD